MYVTFEDLKEVLRRLDELERDVAELKERAKQPSVVNDMKLFGDALLAEMGKAKK